MTEPKGDTDNADDAPEDPALDEVRNDDVGETGEKAEDDPDA